MGLHQQHVFPYLLDFSSENAGLWHGRESLYVQFFRSGQYRLGQG